jgi:uncharacterized protein YbcV (DUF1398 family)
MNEITRILKEATENKWPYPKTFESLKKAGLKSYEVWFEGSYRALYMTDSERFTKTSLEGYKPLKVGTHFFKEKIKDAVINHVIKQTHYLDFLNDIAMYGTSHYKVNMEKRTVTYFNPAESEFYEEHVPKI